MSNRNLILAAAGGAPSGLTDPNFKETVLLLHGDGTNGAQNNTFLDSSTNNVTITRIGNVAQGTFSPFSVADGEWSNYFDSTDDRLSFSATTDFAFGTGDFTIEAWVNPSTVGVYGLGWLQISGTSGGLSTTYTGGVAIYFGTPGAGAVRVIINGTGFATSAGAVNANEWHHFALTRESGTCTIWINGVSAATTTNTDNLTAQNLCIGGYYNTSYLYQGYLSNLAITNGTAKYSSSFTPSTTPLSVSTANQKLLTCYSNRFVDVNTATTAKTVTVTGNPSVQPFSPFAPTAAYDPAVNGGSGYWDNDSDRLEAASNAGFDLSTNAFTYQLWYYPIGAASTDYLIFHNNFTNGFWMFTTTGKKITVGLGNADRFTTTGSWVTNAWNFIQFTRSGTTLSLYINGVLAGSSSVSATVNAGAISIGSYGNTYVVSGYISDVRLVTGSALSATVPTAPLTAIANTQLLLNFTNAGIFDNTGKNNLETVGNAQIDTTTKKYGTGSMEFDGTGDWLLMPDSPNQQLGTGDFTIEFWVYLATGDTGSNRGLVAKGTSTTGFLVSLNTTEKVVFTYATSTITSSGAITTNAWNHIAVVREGTGSNQTKIYIGGTNDGTGTVSTDFNQTSVMYVGANRTGGDPMKGFIDDLRITKGVARYTANFTPPTAALPDL